MRTTSLLSAAALAALLSGCAAGASAAKVAAAPDYQAYPQPSPGSAPATESMDRAASAAPSAPVSQPQMVGQAAPIAPPPATPAVAKSTGAQKDSAPKTEVTNPDLFILYTGDLSLSVEDGKVAPTIDKVIDAAIAAGGHIGSRKDSSVSVVVPSAAFRQTFGAIEHLGEVTHRSIAAEDVSEEYHDAEVRLQNLKATRKRLEDFLSKAPNINDMLTVERELERIVLEIDRIEGRMRFLREHTAFSTLTVNLEARPKPVPVIVAAATPPADPPKAPPRAIDLPAKWLGEIGYGRLLSGK